MFVAPGLSVAAAVIVRERPAARRGTDSDMPT